jgi:hypothetical protein
VGLNSNLERLKKINSPAPISKISTIIHRYKAVDWNLALCKNCDPGSWAPKLRHLRPCKIFAHALSNSSRWRTTAILDTNTHTALHPHVPTNTPQHSFGITCILKAISNPVSWLDDALHISLQITAVTVRTFIIYTSFLRSVC